MEKLYTVDELAEYLKVNRITLYRWLKDKKIEYNKVGNQYRFTEEQVKKFIEKQNKGE